MNGGPAEASIQQLMTTREYFENCTIRKLREICHGSEPVIVIPTKIIRKNDIIDYMIQQEIQIPHTDLATTATASSHDYHALGQGEGEVESSKTFTVTTPAKKSPPPSKGLPARASATAGTDHVEAELNVLRREYKHKWDAKIKEEGQPWTRLPVLESIFRKEMMPKSPVRSKKPTLIMLVGPAAAGKSSALETVHLGLTGNNTVRVDPDRMYESIAGGFGSFPPEIKEIVDPEQKKGESPEKYKERCDKNRAKLEKQNAGRLAWWLANKDTFHERYGSEFKDGSKRDFKAAEFCTPKTHGVLSQYKVALPLMENMIFNGATDSGLNVLLDSTGMMKGPFLQRMASRFMGAGYKIVIVLVVSAENDCKARVSGPGGRNAQQHRKLDEDVVGQIWHGFVREETPCTWERFSRENKTDFAVVENTWTPSNKSGRARVVYKRGSDDITVDPDVTRPDLEKILGTYKVSIKSDGEFECSGGGGAAASKRSKPSKRRDEDEDDDDDDSGPSKRSKHSKHGGSSRKRRISRRRIHCSRARKTIKKYSRPLTRHRRRI